MSQYSPTVLYPRFQKRRRLLKWLAGRALHMLTNLKVEGQENLPESGPMIVVANHFHWADPAVIIHVMPRLVEFIGDTTAPNSPKMQTLAIISQE